MSMLGHRRRFLAPPSLIPDPRPIALWESCAWSPHGSLDNDGDRGAVHPESALASCPASPRAPAYARSVAG
jgi:hypothetical protein